MMYLGWTASERGERLLLGWGNANSSYARGSYQVVYMLLAQEALNDYDNLVKAEELVYLAKVYEGDLAKQEEIYKKALETQSINVDAWLGLIDVYNKNENKTENDYYKLAEKLAEDLKCFPLPMQQLTNLIKPKLKSAEYIYQFTLLQTKTLTEGSVLPNTASDQVMQPSITRTEANFLLGKLDKTIATFSFDGADAGKIVLSNRFNGIGVRWDYCLTGKGENVDWKDANWKEVAFSAEEEHKLQLTQEELKSITAENDIYIHIVGVDYSEGNLYKIDIQESVGLPRELYANDLENKLMATVPGMEWKLNGTDEWTLYGEEEPDLTGNKNVFVRMAATGTRLEGETVEYQFTEDEVNDKRKYIPISHLAIAGYSTQSQDNKRPYYAPNAIDGNGNTLWHTDFAQNVLQQPTKPFISIKLDEPKNIAALEFKQIKYPNRPQDPDDIRNARVYVSIDGETWVQAGQIENCETYGDLYAINFEKPAYGQYVKIEMDTKNMFASLAMVNLYEDTTVVTLGNFSFDGENAGKIILLDEFKGTTWEYSLDGGANWKTVTGDEKQLSPEELAQINVNNKIRLKQGNKESTIEIQNQELPVITAYLNDLENRLIGMGDTSKLEWRIENSAENWTSYSEQEPPRVLGDKKLFVRKKATGTLMASEAVEFQFTADNQANTRKYIPVENLELAGFSAEDKAQNGAAANALDGNYNTRWLNSAAGTDTKKYIIVKFDTDTYLSAMDYVPHSENGKILSGIIEGSMDGENFVEIAQISGWANDQKTKTIDFEESVKVRYVKITGTETSYLSEKRHIGARMFNFYEDTTKHDTPTAEIEYSTEENTNQNVTATLVNKSTEITVTNNDGKDTYTFTENGEFTFEFVDQKGTKGTATAKVDWIVKTLPTPSISYTPNTLTNQDVTATITFDREGTKIIDENGTTIENGNTHVFTENGTHKFRFKGPYGNIGETTASVDWIDKKAPVATITYSSTNLSNQDVMATVTFDEENVTVKDGNTHTFTQNGDYTFEFEDKAGNKGTATANVTWIDKNLPTATIEYSTTNLTNQDVTATVTFDKEGVKIIDEQGEEIDGGNEYTFYENGTHEFKFVGPAGNRGVAVAKVDWIDKVAPVGTIEYSNTNLTNQSVIATITFAENDVTITNNGGKNTYTFEMNGEFEFEFVDKAGNRGTAKAEVEWIDKREIKATITYDRNDITNQDVTATITFDKENVRILNNDGKNTHTFTENGSFEFNFIGPAGNTGTAVANVTWIDKTPPAATVMYDINELTNKNVTATVTFDEGGVTITDKDGNRLENGTTHVFTENGTYTFYYVGPLGNKGTAVATVDWIDTTQPTAEIEYSTTEITNGEVIAKLVNASESITITNNNGSDTYTFTENGEFKFEFVDKAGNKGTVIAKVDWIKDLPEEPENPENPDEYKLGDVNQDGKITATDVLFVKRHLVSAKKQEWVLTGVKFKAGDINKDGKITATDLLLIKRLVLSEMKK